VTRVLQILAGRDQHLHMSLVVSRVTDAASIAAIIKIDLVAHREQPKLP